MTRPRSISFEMVLIDYMNQKINNISAEYYTNIVYVRNNGNTLLYDIRNMSFEGEIIILIGSLPMGMCRLVVRMSLTYTGYLLM